MSVRVSCLMTLCFLLLTKCPRSEMWTFLIWFSRVILIKVSSLIILLLLHAQRSLPCKIITMSRLHQQLVLMVRINKLAKKLSRHYPRNSLLSITRFKRQVFSIEMIIKDNLKNNVVAVCMMDLVSLREYTKST